VENVLDLSTNVRRRLTVAWRPRWHSACLWTGRPHGNPLEQLAARRNQINHLQVQSSRVAFCRSSSASASLTRFTAGARAVLCRPPSRCSASHVRLSVCPSVTHGLWSCSSPFNERQSHVRGPPTTGVNPAGDAGDTSPNILVGGTSTGISPPILLRTFGYSIPILVALRSLSVKPISFGYKTPPVRYSQAGGQSAHKARPPQP